MAYDYSIVGAGVGGLFTGALLASRGKKVYLAERHDKPGGYGQSFERIRHVRRYIFCAQLHYVWGCLPGFPGHDVLRELKLDETLNFSGLGRDCFDRIRTPSFTFDVPIGIAQNSAKICEMFPTHAREIKRYFKTIVDLNDALLALPIGANYFDLLRHPLKFSPLFRYARATLQQFFDELGFPQKLQTILAGQAGNILVPPNRASLVMHAGMMVGYYQSACVPTLGFEHVFETLSKYIRSFPDCRVDFSKEIVEVRPTSKDSVELIAKDEDRIESKVAIYNGDPRQIRKLLKVPISKNFDKKLEYTYSPSVFALYLGLKDIDLERFGFGNFNVWHYARENINEIYEKDYLAKSFASPSLFIGTPTTHHQGTHERPMVPPGGAQMSVLTMCHYDYFKEIHDQSRKHYLDAKKQLSEVMLDIVEANYIPNLRSHIDVKVTASPLTNERYIGAPLGNAYGIDITPENYRIGKIGHRTPFPNVFMIGATAGAPSFAGGIHAARLLANALESKTK
jgi:all-trans-retinol 13,14-reductase